MSPEKTSAPANPSKEQASDKGLSAKLERVYNSPVKGRWGLPYMGSQSLGLYLRGGGDDGNLVGAGIVGALDIEGPATGTVKIRNMQVDQPLRGNGLGRRLLKAFAAEAKLAGATTLDGDIASPEEIHNRAQTFGDDNVKYFEVVEGEGGSVTETDLHLTRAEAIEWLAKAQEGHDDSDYTEKPTINARTDLTRVDISSWESPQLSGASQRPNLIGRPRLTGQTLGDLAVQGPLVGRASSYGTDT